MQRFSIQGTPLIVVVDGETYPGWTVNNLRSAGVPEGAIVAGVKAYLAGEIDAEAERRRQAVTTPGAGQALEYNQAQVEAFDAMAAVAAGKAPVEADYPMLAASVGIDLDPATGQPAADVLGVARSVKAAFASWLVFGAAIRKARLAGKAAVAAAETVDAAAVAAEGIAWPSIG